MSASPRVLIVDDEPDILVSLADVLRAELADADVRVASSGPEALELLRDEPADLILTDYRMPKMNGLEFLRRARLVAPSATVIMMTAYPDATIAREAAGAGVVLLVAKPFEFDTFIELVRGALRREPTVANVSV
ncbi:MAG: response regulator [Thermoplasmatota archaeon]